MAVTIDGLVSGLDTESIVDGLLEIQQAQLDRIELKRSDVLREQTTFSSLEAQLVTFRSQVSGLARVANNPFERQNVSVSDETVLSAEAGTSAATGIYRLSVESVAKAHQIASGGFADSDSEITQGTLEIRTGLGDLNTITIDSSNNTLSGLAETINAAGIGINASVIRDSNGGNTPYKLLLTSSETGSENAISITNNLAASAGDAVQPTFDFDNPVQAAEDARVTLGSGAGAISVESSSNRFTDLIDGVSIDVFNVSDGKEVILNIQRDTEAGVNAVEDFVDSFNSVMSFIDDQSAYNEATEEGGVLLGNRSVINIQQRLRDVVTNVVPGLNREANRLSAIGISVNDNGQLSLNKAQLSNVLNGSNENVSREDIKKLFSLDGTSTNGKIDFVLGSAKTQPNGNGIEVDITQAAERASITADNVLAATTEITAGNRTLEIEVDGATATISLNEGTYTRQELADHLESVINNASDLNGREVNISVSSDKLVIQSDAYGKSSKIKINDGTAIADLGLTAGTVDVGRDVAGTFIVNGVSESATGNGQVLSGNADNTFTADLQLRVQLSPADILSGSEGEVTVTRGIAASLDSILNDMLDPVDGTLKTIDNGFDEELESLQESFDRQQSLFDQQQESLIKQFIELESALAELNSTSDFLATQLSSLQGIGSSSKD